MNHISRTADALENGLRLFIQIFKNKTHNKFSKKKNRSKHHTTKETNQAFKLPEIRKKGVLDKRLIPLFIFNRWRTQCKNILREGQENRKRNILIPVFGQREPNDFLSSSNSALHNPKGAFNSWQRACHKWDLKKSVNSTIQMSNFGLVGQSDCHPQSFYARVTSALSLIQDKILNSIIHYII